MTLRTISTVGRADLAIQCYARGSLVTVAFNPDDVLSAAWYPVGSSVPLLIPSTDWYTAKSTQTGYQQGQVQASLSVAQAATLQGSSRYKLAIWRAPAGNPAKIDPIAELYFVAKAPWEV
jgi:hypothetical protein